MHRGEALEYFRRIAIHLPRFRCQPLEILTCMSRSKCNQLFYFFSVHPKQIRTSNGSKHYRYSLEQYLSTNLEEKWVAVSVHKLPNAYNIQQSCFHSSALYCGSSELGNDHAVTAVIVLRLLSRIDHCLMALCSVTAGEPTPAGQGTRTPHQ